MISEVMYVPSAAEPPRLNMTAENRQSADRYKAMMKEMLKSARTEGSENPQKKESEKKDAAPENTGNEFLWDGVREEFLPENLSTLAFLWLQQPSGPEIAEGGPAGAAQDSIPAANQAEGLMPEQKAGTEAAISAEQPKPEIFTGEAPPLKEKASFANNEEKPPVQTVAREKKEALPKVMDSVPKAAAPKKERQIPVEASEPEDLQQTGSPVEPMQNVRTPELQNALPQIEAEGQTEETAGTASRENLENMLQKLPDDLRSRLFAKEKEFSIQLEPENLGKLMIKASYEQGKATIAIVCTNEKTLQFLSGHAGELGSIMENSLGTPTSIMLDKTPEDYLYQEQNSQNGSHSEPEDSGKGKREQNKKNEGQNFLQQLRLGLV